MLTASHVKSLQTYVDQVPFMNPFYRPFYHSDITQFLRQLKQEKPDLPQQQRAGRALLWDKAVDLEAGKAYRAAQVRQQPYVYQTNAVDS